MRSAWHHLLQWPPLVPGVLLSLPWMGTLLQCRVPCQSDAAESQQSLPVSRQAS